MSSFFFVLSKCLIHVTKEGGKDHPNRIKYGQLPESLGIYTISSALDSVDSLVQKFSWFCVSSVVLEIVNWLRLLWLFFSVDEYDTNYEKPDPNQAQLSKHVWNSIWNRSIKVCHIILLIVVSGIFALWIDQIGRDLNEIKIPKACTAWNNSCEESSVIRKPFPRTNYMSRCTNSKPCWA